VDRWNWANQVIQIYLYIKKIKNLVARGLLMARCKVGWTQTHKLVVKR